MKNYGYVTLFVCALQLPACSILRTSVDPSYVKLTTAFSDIAHGLNALNQELALGENQLSLCTVGVSLNVMANPNDHLVIGGRDWDIFQFVQRDISNDTNAKLDDNQIQIEWRHPACYSDNSNPTPK